MPEWWILLGGVVFSGILTSLSPCPLTTNIAAISFIGRQASNTRGMMMSGLMYAAGRALAYTALAFCVLSMAWFTPESMTRFFSGVIHGYLGPVMILIGMMLLGMFTFTLGGGTESMPKLVEKLGIWSALPLGVLFALAFCPTSAATFLAMLGIAGAAKSPLLFPLIFGIATALPVLLFAFILAFQANLLGKAFQVLTRVDYWMRTVTGTLFILIGLYFSIQYVWLA